VDPDSLKTRIRIQVDSDRDPVLIQGFDDQNLKIKNIHEQFFDKKLQFTRDPIESGSDPDTDLDPQHCV
jgi:hypothetical protein